ncbi:MAG: hydrogenase [Myxococcota bacterium]|jgi:hydrogenase-4 component B|nr:hydrogenase [Myxococcota bacterium]
MMLYFILFAEVLLVATALLATLLGRLDRAALWTGTIGAIAASAVGAGAAVCSLLSTEHESLRSSWPIALGEFHVGMDGLSAFFLLCVFVVSGLSAIYGAGYLRAYLGKQRLAPAVAFFNILIASMAMVILARDGVLFLLAWEAMSISSFFLVTFENERDEVRRAGITYLVASHVGIVFLFALFALFARQSGSFNFDGFADLASHPEGFATMCFVFSLIGFGTKAGFWPVHIWLPDAHPAAPSHVSAVMSGVMIKLGIYGLLRTLTFLGPPPAWWGITFVIIGAVSGIAGVLHALAQHDLKRLLAYHSVENIGIIALGIGVGLLGQTYGNSVVSFLGYAGGLLHVLNHGLFKGLLFHGAGSVIHGTGSRNVNTQGGLYKRMPVTGVTFLIGSMAICGLPPLNGFVSEWLIYLGAFRGSTSPLSTAAGISAVVGFVALALIGGLAAACFVKAFGIVFLGEPRSEAAAKAHEAPWPMKVAMIVGAALCFVIGVWPAGVVTLVGPATKALGVDIQAFNSTLGAMSAISYFAALLIGLIVVLVLLRKALLHGREVTTESTWGCGYSLPTARMQYTASSFAEPLLTPFASALHVEIHRDGPTGCFPRTGKYEEHLQDLAGECVIVPAIQWFLRTVARLGVLQQGRIQLYLVYVLVTLVALLVWEFAGPFGS